MSASKSLDSFDLLAPGEPVRALWIGMGGISATMLKFLMPQPWAHTVAVVDIRPPALEATQQQLDLSDDMLFTDLSRALAAVDEHRANVAIINTPSELHYEQIKAALQAGLHVLVAKPITNNFEQAVELVELASAQRRSLCVGQQLRYNRHYSSVRRYLATGDLGSVEMVQFLNAKPRHKALNLATMTQPALYEMSCHHFDSLLSLLPESAPEWIMIDGFRPSWSVYAGPCSLNGLIGFVNGPHVLYHGGFSSQADLYELRLEGSNGALRCRGIHMSHDIMTYEHAQRDAKWEEIDLDQGQPASSPWQPFFAHWQSVLATGVTLDGTPPPFGGRANLRVFAMLSAGIDAIEHGRPVEIAANPRYAAAFA